MATLAELRDRIKTIIQDTSYSDDEIDGYINEGVLDCATRVLLPALETIGQVTTSTSSYSVSIPANWKFHQNLFSCFDSDGRRIQVLSSLALMQRKFSDFGLQLDFGRVECCCVSVDNFVYYPVPIAAQTLTCGFYKKPILLVNDLDTPTYLPEAFHFALLVSYVCSKLFSQIEDGIDGIKINTIQYLKQYEDALINLQSSIKTGQSRPLPYRTSDWI